MRRITAAILLSYQFLPPTSSFTPSQTRTTLSTSLKSTIVEKDGLFWPSSSKQTDEHASGSTDEDDEEDLLTQTLDSVLKIYATHSEPDFLMPWQKRHQTTSTSSGFVINVPGLGLRVMTNAHSVEYGSVVQVQRRGEDEKHEAVVEAVGNECDLALLRVDSLFPEEDEGLYAMPLGPLPSLQDEVEVLGYPSGGESLCVTKGVVSRIEMQEYAQAGACLLAMQIDAAINPGNSGGPVVNEELEVVGVAFQGLDEVENCGYVVPVSVVRHFLEDVKRNNGYTGFCQLGVNICFLENQAFRKYLQLEEGSSTTKVNGDKSRRRRSGVMIRSIAPTSGACGKLQSKDVIMAVDGIPVGSDGKIPFRRGERVDLPCYISSLFDGDVLKVTIWRNGEEMDVSVPLTPMDALVPSHFHNKPPPYLICSGFVFTALSVPYLEAKGAWDDYYSDSVSHLLGLVHTPLQQKGDEVVVLSQVLAHKANLQYENYMDLHLLEFNGIEVKSLVHLQQLIDESTGPFMTFQFAPKDGGKFVVLDHENHGGTTKAVCEEHSIGAPFLFHTES
jgi:S1-C subfamily serine protease